MPKRPRSTTPDTPHRTRVPRLRGPGDTPTRETFPPSVLDHTAFPHIIDMILSYTTFDDWMVIRATSREFRDRMEGLMCRHIRVEEDHGRSRYYARASHADREEYRFHDPYFNYVEYHDPDDYCPGYGGYRYGGEHRDKFRLIFTTPHHPYKKIPCLSLIGPFRERTLRLLRKHTTVLDDETHEKGAFSWRVKDAFIGLQVVRGSYYRSLKVNTPKAIVWHRLQSLWLDGDEWPQEMDSFDNGLEHVPHQVHHITYHPESIIFSPYSSVDWDAAEEMVFIFEDEDPNGMSAQYLRLHSHNGQTESGRDDPISELAFLFNFLGLGMGRTAPLTPAVKITFVNLAGLLNIDGIECQRTGVIEDDPNVAVRRLAEVLATCNNPPGFSAWFTQMLKQTEFLSIEEYILRVGQEQFDFETSR